MSTGGSACRRRRGPECGAAGTGLLRSPHRPPAANGITVQPEGQGTILDSEPSQINGSETYRQDIFHLTYKNVTLPWPHPDIHQPTSADYEHRAQTTTCNLGPDLSFVINTLPFFTKDGNFLGCVLFIKGGHWFYCVHSASPPPSPTRWPPHPIISHRILITVLSPSDWRKATCRLTSNKL